MLTCMDFILNNQQYFVVDFCPDVNIIPLSSSNNLINHIALFLIN